MIRMVGAGAALVAAMLLVPGTVAADDRAATALAQPATLTVTVDSRTGPHSFVVEVARTTQEQARGLMFRTNLPADGGMLFTPYPAEGKPREASFWMKNTPSALDILFIRRNGTIAAIAANAEPYSETPYKSGEPVRAVLEIKGGKAAELGIAVGDTVRWPGQKR